MKKFSEVRIRTLILQTTPLRPLGNSSKDIEANDNNSFFGKTISGGDVVANDGSANKVIVGVIGSRLQSPLTMEAVATSIGIRGRHAHTHTITHTCTHAQINKEREREEEKGERMQRSQIFS